MELTGKKIARATKWSFITEIGSKLVSPIVNMILARVFTPSIFGIIATLTMVISFADIFTDAGFQKYLVQHEFRDIEELNKATTVAFWSNLFISTVIYIIIFCFATSICNLVGNEGIESLLRVAALTILLTSFSSIQQARYKRGFAFDKLCKIRIIGSFLPLFVTVPLAIFTRNCWAYVIGQLALQFYNAVILTIFSEWKPSLYFSLKKLIEMLSFSLWTLLESVSIWMSLNIGTFIVGTVLDNYWLGIYKTSMQTINSYMGLITATVTPVLFSSLSRMQNEEYRFNQVLLSFQRYVAIIVVPIGIGIYVYNDLITKILLGDQWVEAASYLGIWGLMYALKIVYSNFNSEAFRSKGKPILSLIVQVTYLIILIPGLIYFVNIDFRSMFYFRALSISAQIMISSIMLNRLTGISLIDMIKNTVPSLVGSLAIIVIGVAVKVLGFGYMLQVTSVIVCMVVYFTVLILAFPKQRREIYTFVYPYVNKIFCK